MITFIKYRDWKINQSPHPTTVSTRLSKKFSGGYHHQPPPQNTDSTSKHSINLHHKTPLGFSFLFSQVILFVVFQGKFPWQPLIPIIIILYIITKVIKTLDWLARACSMVRGLSSATISCKTKLFKRFIMVLNFK